jgi:hypothetical protein
VEGSASPREGRPFPRAAPLCPSLGPAQRYSERVYPGAIAQLGERRLCKAEVAGSIPAGSTTRSQSEPSCRDFSTG